MATIEQAAALGISSPYARGFMPFTEADGVIRTNYAAAARTLAQDAALSTAPNTGIPSAYLTYLDPEITTILFAAQNATKLFAESRKGDWATAYAQFPVEEVAGDVTPYQDFNTAVSADVNYNFPTRQNFIFQTSLKYGMREQDTAAQARLSLAGAKQKAAAAVLARAHNRFYLYGVRGVECYGALNDPNLPESESPISVGGKSTWADKVATNADTAANVIFNDVAKLIGTLIGNAQGHVDQNTRFVLAVGSKRFSYLTLPNSFGKTALSLIKENYPHCEVIQLPELDTAAGSMLYLTAPEIAGEKTAECVYSEKMRFLNVEAHSSFFTQKAVGGTWGCIIRRPFAVATMLGI